MCNMSHDMYILPPEKYLSIVYSLFNHIIIQWESLNAELIFWWLMWAVQNDAKNSKTD